MSDESDHGPGSEPWLTRFRELNSPTEDLISVDADGNPVPEAVCGTLTWSRFAVAEDEDGDATQAALIVKFAPLGEMDPAQAMHLHMKVVSPKEAIALMVSIMDATLDDDFVLQIKTLIDNHLKEAS